MPVNVHGRLDAGMAELLLGVRQGFPVLHEKRSRDVPQIVKPPSSQFGPVQAPPLKPVHDVLHLSRIARCHRKNPLRDFVLSFLKPLLPAPRLPAELRHF
jgi:hypothetical protein